MTITNIELLTDKDTVTLQARCKLRKLGWDTVYFTVDAKYREAVCRDASPFAAALLLPSMKQGEDLIIRGSISKQLYEGMQAIMQEVSAWGIGLKPIKIKADTIVADDYHPTETASFFSGGVDSFYTYLKHKHDKAKSHRVGTFIFVNNNFDVDPRNTPLWEQTINHIATIAQEEQVAVVVVKSNINSLGLLNPILSWDYIHGSCLAAVGLLLRKQFARIYIPSTHSVDEQIPWGSNLALDTHWSSEKTQFIHDGSETTRLNKVVTQLAKSPIALKHLRVCYMNVEGEYNCGRCDKCLRTMVNLYIAGALGKSQTFPRKLDLQRIATTPTIMGENLQIFHNENLAALRKRHLNPQLQDALESSIALTLRLKPSRAGKLRDKIAYLDHQYLRSYVYLSYNGLFGKKYS